MLVVALSDDFMPDADSFQLSATGHVLVNGELHLGATEAELRAAVEAALAASASLH